VSGRFTGRRALVTGASRGIGAGVAERLGAGGASVALVARTLDEHDHLGGGLQRTVARVERHGSVAAPIVADLSVEAERSDVVAKAAELLGGPIDILVNNAAAAMYGEPSQLSLRRRRILVEVNLHAPLDLAQAAVPAMKERGAGWIVNVSSGTARMFEGPPYALGRLGTTTTSYGASKAALNRVTNGLAAELWSSGVRVNTVEPRAAVLTEGADALAGSVLRADQIESVEEMVEAVVALCDCGADVTGRSFVSLDLLREWAIEPRALDGGPWRAPTDVPDADE
jgi:NAD(P)-dependent dehydrogenase (short-subunit alcohol dehydrogenase family)